MHHLLRRNNSWWKPLYDYCYHSCDYISSITNSIRIIWSDDYVWNWVSDWIHYFFHPKFHTSTFLSTSLVFCLPIVMSDVKAYLKLKNFKKPSAIQVGTIQFVNWYTYVQAECWWLELWIILREWIWWIWGEMEKKKAQWWGDTKVWE